MSMFLVKVSSKANLQIIFDERLLNLYPGVKSFKIASFLHNSIFRKLSSGRLLCCDWVALMVVTWQVLKIEAITYLNISYPNPKQGQKTFNINRVRLNFITNDINFKANRRRMILR